MKNSKLSVIAVIGFLFGAVLGLIAPFFPDGQKIRIWISSFLVLIIMIVLIAFIKKKDRTSR